MRKPCCEKQDNNNKGAWTKQEDQKLVDYIRKHGKGCWRTLPQAAGLLRCGKSCRLRWINYLRPDLKRGNFAEDEEDLIVKLHALLGNRWSLIAGRLPGRTDNEVKNYWNSHLSRKLTNMGLDPNNHRRLLGLPKQLAPNNIKISATNSGTNNKISISDEEASKQVRGGLKCTEQQVSDAGSCLEDDVATSGRLLQLDLNLDLTIKCPIANNNVVVDGHNDINNNNVNESESASMEVSLLLAPTLSLFR